MSSKNGVVSSSRGPVVQTRTTGRAPEVRVRFPEATADPSMLARGASKVSGWFAGLGESALWGVGVVILIAAIFGPYLSLRSEHVALRRRVLDQMLDQYALESKVWAA